MLSSYLRIRSYLLVLLKETKKSTEKLKYMSEKNIIIYAKKGFMSYSKDYTSIY